MNYAEIIADLKKHASYLSPEQKKLLKENSVESYQQIIDSIRAPNIFLPKYPAWERNDLFKTMTRIWTDPEHIYLACKHLFGVTLATFQTLIMEVLLTHKYPMLIASRGGSKCIDGDTLVCTDTGFVRIGDLIGRNQPEKIKIPIKGSLLGWDRWNEIDYGWNNGFGRTIKIQSSAGFILEGVPEHKIWAIPALQKFPRWMTLDEIIEGDYVCLDTTHDWSKLIEVKREYSQIDCIVRKSVGFGQTFDVHLKNNHEFVSNGFISHNSFLLALMIMYIMTFDQGTKVVVAGSGLRQSKVIFGYMKKIWNSAKVLRELIPTREPLLGVNDCQWYCGDSTAIGLPIGDGEKIRGQRANWLIIDEFKSLSEDIYERVLSPFTSVPAEPVKRMQEKAYEELMADIGIDVHSSEDDLGNRSIISGTADYEFAHFAKYWKQYKRIILSGGDPEKLRDVYGGNDPPSKFNWKNYAIVRLPFEKIPKNFMDEESVARAKLTASAQLYANEYGACFVKDSDGFFPRSMIEGCTAIASHKICTREYENVSFEPMTEGFRNRQYAFGVDTASEKDNFAIVILELWPDHRRIVYCWTITKKKYMQEFRQGDLDFYSYCARHILNLKKKFPTKCIAIDAGGGGLTVEESLHNQLLLEDTEVPLWRAPVEGKDQQTDQYVGEHILHMIQFANKDWTYNANHGLKQDMSDKSLLFPSPFAAETKIAELVALKKDTDDLENVVLEIDELKDELTTIEHQYTANGTDRWDVPAIKSPGQKKGKLKKDRYSALVMANAEAKTLHPKKFQEIEYQEFGYSILENIDVNPQEKGFYLDHEWFYDEVGGLVV